MKKLIWTPTAIRSLQLIIDFLEEIWNQQVIDAFLNKLDFRIEQIKINPELAPTFENSDLRQLLIHKSVSLFYRNSPEHLKILLIWDNRQNSTELFRKLTDANSR